MPGYLSASSLGVFGASFAAIKLGIAALPAGASIGQLYGVAILTGIGFTMSLFIGSLAFDDEGIMAQVRLGVLVASLVSGLAAAIFLKISTLTAEKATN